MANALLFSAAEANSLDAVARLLEEDGALVNHANGAGQTALHVATSKGHVKMIAMLIAYGADVGTRTMERYGGLCALHMAARFDATEAAQELVKGGAAVNQLSCTGSTPLIEAAKFGSLAFVTWLLSIAGVNAALTDSSGFSARTYASKAGHSAVAKLLPAVKFDLWAQLKSEPGYANNLAGVQATLAIKQRKLEKKAALEEAKKKKKPF